MLIPNQKLDTMELLYPKRKPVGKVKIDWSHPLSKGLVEIAIPTISGIDGLGLTTWVNTIKKDNVVTSSGIALTSVQSYHTQRNFSVDVDYTLVTSIASPTNNSTAVSLSASKIWIGLVGGDFVVSGSGGQNLPVSVRTYNKFTSIAVRAKGSVQEGFSSGKLVGNVYPNTGVLTPLYLHEWANGSYFFNGNTLYAFAYNRALSDQEIKSLHDDPYQFLISV